MILTSHHSTSQVVTKIVELAKEAARRQLPAREQTRTVSPGELTSRVRDPSGRSSLLTKIPAAMEPTTVITLPHNRYGRGCPSCEALHTGRQ